MGVDAVNRISQDGDAGADGGRLIEEADGVAAQAGAMLVIEPGAQVGPALGKAQKQRQAGGAQQQPCRGGAASKAQPSKTRSTNPEETRRDVQQRHVLGARV